MVLLLLQENNKERNTSPSNPSIKIIEKIVYQPKKITFKETDLVGFTISYNYHFCLG